MSDDETFNWDKVERAIEKGRTKVEKGPLGLEPQSSKAKALSPERPADPKGIIHQYKAVKIGRGVALQKLAAWHQAELEVVKIRLIEAVRVNKAQAYFQAEQFLASLEADHRAHLALKRK